MFHRWCESCGVGLSRQQWERANFCSMCGVRICKEVHAMSRDGPLGKLEQMVPAEVMKPLQVVRKAVDKHPVASALGSVGAGAAGIMLSPLAMTAGQGLAMVGGVLLLLGFITKADFGLRYGTMLLVTGIAVYGSGFVLMGAGGVAVATGLGLGAYSGVNAIAGLRRSKLVVTEPLLLEGGDYESG